MLRGFSVWRKDLVHVNKTRDNHFMRFGEYYDMTLLVRASARIGDHISDRGTKVVPIKTLLKGSAGYIEFYIRACIYYLLSHRKNSYDFILSPIGEEPIGWLLRVISFTKPCLVFDLWDVPGLTISRSRSWLKEVARSAYERILPGIIKSGDFVIAGVMKKGLADYLRPGQFVIESENAVDSNSFIRSTRKEAAVDFDSDSLKLVYSGYVHPSRGASDLVGLVAELQQKSFPVKLYLVGPYDDPGRIEIERLAVSSEVNDKVVFIGEIPSDLIPSVITRADICFCPLEDIEKFRWSFPVKIYEYLALGCVVVASDLPGIRELIRDGENGFLYKSGDVSSLADIVLRASSNIELSDTIRRNAISSVAGKDWDSVFKKVVSSLTPSLEANRR